MTIHALVTGTIFRDPEQRTSKSGKAFTTATLRIKAGEEVTWIKILAFGTDAQAELIRLGDGDTVSVSGSLKADFYTPEGGSPRVNLTVFAGVVLALRQPPKPKKQETIPERAPSASGYEPDDSIPF